ncbi:MAG: hypothetical protein PWR24_1457 [Desulfonauticus sp.]|jgi:HSP20 family protein|nr:MAG: Heat shock protein Hsp20 [Desulfonauticus sp. 38_4375]MDK2921900.1 hypothetical protein [Desulfonauticus sp.]
MAKLILNPWLELQDMRDEILKLMEAIEDVPSKQKERDIYGVWKPVADVYEVEDGFVIEIEVPGISEDKINLELKGSELRIYGERRLEKDVSGSEYHLLERSYGPFVRKFTLPDYVEKDKISARLKDGVLVITLPKKKDLQRNIKIEVK